MLELTALPTIRKESWVPAVREADVLPVWGGDVLNLRHWMRQSGLAEFDLEFVPSGSDMALEADRALGLVDFILYPPLDREDMPDASLADIERWASGISAPTSAIDDETAIKVIGDTIEVDSEGNWKLFNA